MPSITTVATAIPCPLSESVTRPTTAPTCSSSPVPRFTSAACPCDVSSTSTPASYSTALKTAPTVSCEALKVTCASSGTTAALYVRRKPARWAMMDSACASGTSLRSTEITLRNTAALLASVHRGAASLERFTSNARNRGPATARLTPSTGSWVLAVRVMPAMSPATSATTALQLAPPFTAMRIIDLPFG